jgi:hypothetical protein
MVDHSTMEVDGCTRLRRFRRSATVPPRLIRDDASRPHRHVADGLTRDGCEWRSVGDRAALHRRAVRKVCAGENLRSAASERITRCARRSIILASVRIVCVVLILMLFAPFFCMSSFVRLGSAHSGALGLVRARIARHPRHATLLARIRSARSAHAQMQSHGMLRADRPRAHG